MVKKWNVGFVLVALLVVVSNAWAIPIVNGDFSSSGAGWSAELVSGDPPAIQTADVKVENGKAVLEMQEGFFLSSLYQSVTFTQPGTLQFSLTMLQRPDAPPPPDSLVVDDFLNVYFYAETASLFFGAYSGSTDYSNPFTFGVTDLFNTPGTLYFDLKDELDGKLTTFLIDDVIFTPSSEPVPEPSTLCLFACVLGLIVVRSRIFRLRSAKTSR